MKETRILIKENVELSDAHIQNAETNLLRPLTAIAAAIKAININPTKDLIIDVLANDAQKVEAILREHNPINSGDSRIDRMIEQQTAHEVTRIAEIGARYKGNTLYNGVKISNPAIARLFDTDSDGNPYILDSFIESMKEECREYVKTPIGAKLHKLQANMVMAIQNFWDAIDSIKDEDGIQPSWGTRMALKNLSFVNGFVEVKETESGKLFKAKPINFDPEEIEEDSEWDSDNDV